MVRILKLTDQVVDPSMSANATAQQINLHVLKVGHGIGRIDFTRLIFEMSDDDYNNIVESCDGYGKFKLGNLHKFSEIDINPAQAERLVQELPPCRLRRELEELREGYLTIRIAEDGDAVYPVKDE